jgi:hypothetical protein
LDISDYEWDVLAKKIDEGKKFDVNSFTSFQKKYEVEVEEFFGIQDRIETHILKGEFDANGYYKFGGLHDYDNFKEVVDNNLIHSGYEWRWGRDKITGMELNNPEGVSVVQYRKVGAVDWKEKTLAPQGTTTQEFMEAGLILRNDYMNGNFEPSGNFIYSNNQYKNYYIQGYAQIGEEAGKSSWWLTTKHPIFNPE